MSENATTIAADLIREAEGFRAKPYLCPAGVATVGWGFTRYADGRRVSLNDPPMSREDAEALLAAAVWREAAKVQGLVPGVDGPRLAALIDFTFNVGTEALRKSTLRKVILEDDWRAACIELRRWVYAGSRVLPGLVARRDREIKLIEETL